MKLIICFIVEIICVHICKLDCAFTFWVNFDVLFYISKKMKKELHNPTYTYAQIYMYSTSF